MSMSMSMSTEYEYLYAFPIWLLSFRINNVIASLWGRHKMLATNNPNIQVLYLRHTLELAIVENLLTKKIHAGQSRVSLMSAAL